MNVSSPPSSPRTAVPPLPREVPPEWPIERWIKAVGKLTGALGKGLDWLAKVPVIGWVVRVFSSVWVGIGVLVMLGIYIGIGSGFASLRAALEMTDLQFFNAVPMQVLLALLAADLIVVTLRRIPLTLFKLGSWTVHVGILTLITGCIWYFGLKHESSARLWLNQPTKYCYDVTERALYAFPVKEDGTFDAEHPVITPLPGLPIYYEHLEANGRGLDMVLPESALPGKGGEVRIRGYYPAAILQLSDFRAGRAGEKGFGPAVHLRMQVRQHDKTQWLLGDSPAGRVMEGEFPFGVEYLSGESKPSAKRLAELKASFEGPLGLTVRVPKAGVERTMAFKPSQVIEVEGTPYTLTPGALAAIDLVSPGYEGSSSTTLSVAVSRKEPDGKAPFEFSRMCLSRYPERSPDFLNGVRKQEGVDLEIEIIFHDARQTEAWIVEEGIGGGMGMSLIVRTPDGKSSTAALEPGKPLPLPVAEMPGLELLVKEKTPNAMAVRTPLIIPPEQRRPGQMVMELIQFSIIEVEVKGSQRVYVPFSQFAAIGDRPQGEQPVVIDLPDGRQVGLLLATTRRELPAVVTLTKFNAQKYPGAARTFADYRSTLKLSDLDGKNERMVETHLNNPAADSGLYYFQAAWDGDENAPPEKRFSVVGIGNRPGISVMVVGAGLIVLGIAYAFYVKPILLKAKKESLAAWAAWVKQRAPAG